MPCTAVNNHFLDRKQGSTYRLGSLSLTPDLVLFSALWSKACDGVNGVHHPLSESKWEDSLLMMPFPAVLQKKHYFLLGFLGWVWVVWRCFFLPRKVSCHLTSPLAHPVSNSDPRNQQRRRTKTYVRSCLQDLLNLQPLIHKTLEGSWRTTINIFLPSAYASTMTETPQCGYLLSAMKGERSTARLASKGLQGPFFLLSSAEEGKKVVIYNPDLSLSCFPMAQMEEQNTAPQAAVLHKGIKVTHTPAPSQAMLGPPCTPHLSP